MRSASQPTGKSATRSTSCGMRQQGRHAAAVQPELPRSAERHDELADRRPPEPHHGADREHQPDGAAHRRRRRRARLARRRHGAALAVREEPADRPGQRDGHEQGDGGDEQRHRPPPARRQQPDRGKPAEHAEHAGELEHVEPHRRRRTAVVLQDRGEAADHRERVAEAGQHAAEDEHGKRPRRGQQEEAQPGSGWATRPAWTRGGDRPATPHGTSAIIRARPKEPARMPSSQSASAWVRAISGRSGPKAPMQSVLQKARTQSAAVPSKRPAIVIERGKPSGWSETGRSAADQNGRSLHQG